MNSEPGTEAQKQPPKNSRPKAAAKDNKGIGFMANQD